MSVIAPKQNLLNFDPNGLQQFFADHGEKPFRSTQLLKWIYHRGISDFAAMTDFSKSLRTLLSSRAEIRAPEMVVEQNSNDGTRKWLLRLDDGNCIETVFIPESGRGTLCISSQVGCILNCSFCSTAKQGFNRNLTTSEIIGQLWIAAKLLGQFEANQQHRIITNVVFMGMGEPLLNYDQVLPALRLMLEDNAFGLSKRRVTLSTAGIIPALDKLREDCDVSLAISLHATTDELRNELVPVNKKYPIADLLAACKRYVDDTARKKITFEYVMLRGINDQAKHAKELVKLLQGIPAKINLIPFNPYPNSVYKTSTQADIDVFYHELYRAGMTTITRRTRGEDIDAACGQLAGKVLDRTQRRERIKKQLNDANGEKKAGNSN